jgi:hypothetical protein
MAGNTSIGGTPRATDDRTAGGGTRPPPLNSPSQTPARSTRPSPHSATRTLCAPSAAETADDLSAQDRELMSQDRDLDVNVRRATDPTRPCPKAS